MARTRAVKVDVHTAGRFAGLQKLSIAITLFPCVYFCVCLFLKLAFPKALLVSDSKSQILLLMRVLLVVIAPCLCVLAYMLKRHFLAPRKLLSSMLSKGQNLIDAYMAALLRALICTDIVGFTGVILYLVGGSMAEVIILETMSLIGAVALFPQLKEFHDILHKVTALADQEASLPADSSGSTKPLS
ncbi:hypothetical protein ACFL1X_08905 [Candidatus Hydrogenedentota bacterium]